MPLSSEERRKVLKYLSQGQITGWDGTVFSTSAVEEAMDSLTAAGVITVQELLVDLDTLWTKLRPAEERFQAVKVGSIELRTDEWDQRLAQFRFYLEALDAALGGIVLGAASGARSALQGPYQEP